jgi:hypothetical protein
MLYLLSVGFLLGLLGITDAANVLERMKIAYCYTTFSMDIENPKLNEKKVLQSRANADKLLPAFRTAVDESNGTLTATMLETESEKARNNKSRGFSAAEYFMIRERCERLVVQ